MNTTLTATTAREITFAQTQLGTGRQTRTFPAGTTVYATEMRNGAFRARVPGTLFEQEVYAGSLIPA